MTYKLLALDGLHKDGVEALTQNSIDFEVHQGLTQEQLSEKGQSAQALIVRSATKLKGDIWNLFPQLKVVVRAGVGVDNIDLVEAKKRGVYVYNAPSGNFQSTAELALAHIFSMSRFLPHVHQAFRDNNWAKKQYSKKGRQIQGKVLGIVGMGNIGRKLAHMAVGLGMMVQFFDPFVKEDFIELNNVKIVKKTKDELLSSSDYISLHIPKIKETHHFIAASELELMQKTAYLINCSRGGLVDEVALIKALKENQIQAAALDVFEQEPTDFESIHYQTLFKLENLFSTPHLGASTTEAQSQVSVEACQKIMTFFEQPDRRASLNPMNGL